jgi:signal transduction histidine kinase
MTNGLAEREQHVNGAILGSVSRLAAATADLLLLPVVAIAERPLDAPALAEALGERGLRADAGGVTDALDRAAELGLVKVAGHGERGTRYVATALGRRAARAFLLADPDVRIGLEEVERLRTELLATIGHELRTPLTAIRTSVGLLLDPGLAPSEDQRQELLVTIGRSADRMQRLVTELLDLARLRAGRVEMRRRAFDARDVLADVAAAVAPMAAAHDQRIRLDVPDEPVRVVADRSRIEQALLNLAANAQRFSPPSGDIDLVCRQEDGSVRWTVVDRGPGIGEEEQQRLFERFFVGSTDGGGAGRGVGLGLPTALAIAQAHGGTIEVDSTPGRGSTFHLVVPATARR